MKKIILVISFVSLSLIISALPKYYQVKSYTKKHYDGETSERQPIDFEVNTDGEYVTVNYPSDMRIYHKEKKLPRVLMDNKVYDRYECIDDTETPAKLTFEYKKRVLISIKITYKIVEYVIYF